MTRAVIDMLVNIDVDDLDRAVDFYRRALGLTLGRRLSATIIEMLGASAPIYLLEKPAGSPAFEGAPQARTYDRHWTPVHLDFAVEHLERAVQKRGPREPHSKAKASRTRGGAWRS